MNPNLKYKVTNRELRIITDDGDKIINFKYVIRQVLMFENCILVRIEPDFGKIYNENVFGISYEGIMLWQIQRRSHIYEDSPYTQIDKCGKNALLINWDGTDLTIDPVSGKILNVSHGK